MSNFESGPGDIVECLCCNEVIDSLYGLVCNAYDHAVENKHVIKIERPSGHRYYVDDRGIYGADLPRNSIRNHIQISTKKNPIPN